MDLHSKYNDILLRDYQKIFAGLGNYKPSYYSRITNEAELDKTLQEINHKND